MNTFKVLSLILFFAHTVEAQPALPLPLPLADSIWHIWQNEPREDSTLLQTIYDYAWDGYLFTQTDNAFYYSQLQYDFAKTRDLKRPMADAYMAAGGLPTPTNSCQGCSPCRFGNGASGGKGKSEKIKEGLPFFEVRIGIHTGPVVAGIVGVKKFQYDIWGDTVNTASRMESSGEAGKVNISQSTYELLKPDGQFEFESRGKIAAKGKGEIEMYFVSSLTQKG